MSLRQRYSVAVEEDRRLAVLQVLALSGEGRDRELNTRLLSRVLEEWGRRPSADELRTTLAWLSDQGLVEIERIDGLSSSIERVRLLERGADVADGRARVPGVAVPRPGDA